MVNRRIFVVGFGLYGSIHGPTEYTVNIQVLYDFQLFFVCVCVLDRIMKMKLEVQMKQTC